MSVPEQVIEPRLLVRDFDGTDALTFAPSPNNMNVEKAYELSIHDQFGAEALRKYLAGGGLGNRAPGEIVASLLPSSDPTQLKADTDALVEKKLDFLMSEIGEQPDGTIWPEPMPGFRYFCKKIKKAKEDGHDITTATISSGHTEFIKKVFELWELPSSDILITDDTLRGLPDGCIAKNAVKPSSYLMSLAWARWQNLRGDKMDPEIMRKSTLYVGDDMGKDGGLARNSGVHFVHMGTEIADDAWFVALRWLGVADLATREALTNAR